MNKHDFPEVLVTDRRGNDRRKRQIPVALERRTGKDRRDQQGESAVVRSIQRHVNVNTVSKKSNS